MNMLGPKQKIGLHICRVGLKYSLVKLNNSFRVSKSSKVMRLVNVIYRQKV